jgi:hypothetical protein
MLHYLDLDKSLQRRIAKKLEALSVDPLSQGAITTDELLGLKSERPPTAKPKNPQLWRRFRQIEKLPLSERRQLLGVIDGVLERHRLREAS